MSEVLCKLPSLGYQFVKADSLSFNIPLLIYPCNKVTYDYGEYVCKHSGDPLFSTDALLLHELMNSGGSNGEMFGQIMSTLEKLWLVHILRAFEKKGWLATL